MTRFDLDAEKKLIVALDVDDAGLAYDICHGLALPSAIFKIGLELLFNGGIELAKRLSSDGLAVFIDAKLLDIGNTVERATAQIAALDAKFLTVHAQDMPTVEAAMRGRQGSALKLLGITVLTNIGESVLRQQGYDLTLGELAERRASFAAEAGLDGVVSSPREAAAIKARFGSKLTVVTPGIRLGESNSIAADDHARSATPREAILAGADYLVVGRPILKAKNPRDAARSIIAETSAAIQRRELSNGG